MKIKNTILILIYLSLISCNEKVKVVNVYSSGEHKKIYYDTTNSYSNILISDDIWEYIILDKTKYNSYILVRKYCHSAEHNWKGYEKELIYNVQLKSFMYVKNWMEYYYCFTNINGTDMLLYNDLNDISNNKIIDLNKLKPGKR